MIHFQALSNVMARRPTKEHVVHGGKDGLEMWSVENPVEMKFRHVREQCVELERSSIHSRPWHYEEASCQLHTMANFVF